MAFIDLARQRYSERYFSSKPVEQEKLELILEAGRIAPTGCNNQPQRIYVIQSEAAINKYEKKEEEQKEDPTTPEEPTTPEDPIGNIINSIITP